MSDPLFAQAVPAHPPPLAERMRPRSLDEFIGQDHVVGPGKLLRRAIQQDRLTSIILSGPPGTGKTTLSRIIANATAARFESINAVLAGVQAIRDTIEAAQRERSLHDRKTILFVDEVHRWNKAQQDALLPWVENGTIVLIGATTENPFFEVNKALVSRSRIFELRTLSRTDLEAVAGQAIADRERGYGNWRIAFESGALEHLIDNSGGDARCLLNALELAVETTPGWPLPQDASVDISLGNAAESIQKRVILYDKGGDTHYDTISAFIKSIRGSDADASLYWLARMLRAGEDPHFIMRRLLVSASEDIGLADPQAIVVVQSCAAAFDRVGLPEGQFHLAQACLYLATAKKSSSTLAFFDAMRAVEQEQAEVPEHLRDSARQKQGSTTTAYVYPHDAQGHWVAQQYLPDPLRSVVFYKPGTLGYEGGIREDLLRQRELQMAAMLDSAGDPGAEGGAVTGHRAWKQRMQLGPELASLADIFLSLHRPQPDCRVILLNERAAGFAKTIQRACPGVSVSILCRQPDLKARLEWLYASSDAASRPLLIPADQDSVLPDRLLKLGADRRFTRTCLLGLDYLAPLARRFSPEQVAGSLASQSELTEPAEWHFIEQLPPAEGILSRYTAGALDSTLQSDFAAFDSAFYDSESARVSKQLEDCLCIPKPARWNRQKIRLNMDKSLTRTELDSWLDPLRPWGKALSEHFSQDRLALIRSALYDRCDSGPVAWPREYLLISST